MSQGSDVEDSIALARQDVSEQIQRGPPLGSFYDTKVGKSLLYVAYIVPIIWCVNKITTDPLFLYTSVIDDDKKCFALDKWSSTMTRFLNPLSIVLDVVCLCSLVMKVGLLEKRFEKTIWFFLILFDLWTAVTPYFPYNQELGVLWPNTRSSDFYLANAFIVQYFGTVLLLYIMFTRATSISATLAKATWAKAAFNLLLYIHGGHVFGGIWYAFSIEKEMDCWSKACKKYALSLDCSWQGFFCDNVGNGREDYTILNEMCSTKTRNTSIYDFGIYHDALESGIVEVSSLPRRILHCLCWGLQNISGFGQNLRVSTDALENIFVIFFTIYGLVWFVFFIGNMQIYLQLKTQRSEEIRQKKNDIKKSKSFAKLSGNLKQQIKRYLPDKWEETKDVHLENLLNNVPNDIKMNIKRELCLEILRTADEFRSWSDEMLDELCDCAKPVSYTQYAQIIRKGSSIDEMLLFVHGKLQTYSLTNVNTGFVSTNVSTSTIDSESTAHWKISIDHLEDGMFCGEELVDWFRANPYSSNLPISTKTIQTLTKVDAFALMSYDLQNVFIKHRTASAPTQRSAPPAESQPYTLVEYLNSGL